MKRSAPCVDLITAKALNARITKNVYGGKGGPLGDITELLMNHKALMEEVEYLRRWPADIPTIRAKFQPLHDRAKEAWQGTDPRNEASYKKWLDAWHEIRKEEVALCMKYFGHDLEIDGEYLEPLMVLDWIEHFLEAEP